MSSLWPMGLCNCKQRVGKEHEEHINKAQSTVIYTGKEN